MIPSLLLFTFIIECYTQITFLSVCFTSLCFISRYSDVFIIWPLLYLKFVLINGIHFQNTGIIDNEADAKISFSFNSISNTEPEFELYINESLFQLFWLFIQSLPHFNPLKKILHILIYLQQALILTPLQHLLIKFLLNLVIRIIYYLFHIQQM